MNVPVGPATRTGYSVTLAAFALAVAAYITGDHSDQTIGVIVSGAIGLASLLVTQLGRYAQAHAQAKVVAQVQQAQLEEEGPGDPNALPHRTVSPPGVIPPDEGDAAAAR